MDGNGRARRVRKSTLGIIVTFGLVAGIVALSAPAGLAAGATNRPTVGVTIPGPSATLQRTSPFSSDFTTMSFIGSGSGDVTGSMTWVVGSSGPGGCDAVDFAGFPAGNIALMERGLCAFGVKAANAQNNGAVGVIIFNGLNLPPFTPESTLLPFVASIPVVNTSFAEGIDLAFTFPGSTTVRVAVGYSGSVTITYTINRQAKAIASRTCTFDGAPESCGDQSAAEKKATTYTVTLTGFGAGSHTFVVNATTSDGGSASGSGSFIA